MLLVKNIEIIRRGMLGAVVLVRRLTMTKYPNPRFEWMWDVNVSYFNARRVVPLQLPHYTFGQFLPRLGSGAPVT